MSRPIENKCENYVTVTGTLLDVNMREGTSKSNNNPYRYGTATVRTLQTYGGREEVSEIPVNFIASKYKKDGSINSSYESLSKFGNSFKSAANFGIGEASRIKITGTLGESMYASKKDDNVNSTWRVNARFFDEPNNTNGDLATFRTEIYILSISRETNFSGEETGRLKIRGGIIQYGSVMDCLDFYIEDPEGVDYFERNFEVNNTVEIKGRIRYSVEEVETRSSGSWGEDIPETSTRVKRELIISKSSDEPLDDDYAFDPAEVKVLAQDRTNRKEQVKLNNKNKAAVAKEKASSMGGYSWEE